MQFAEGSVLLGLRIEFGRRGEIRLVCVCAHAFVCFGVGGEDSSIHMNR